jgi:hypothetical protein
LRPRLAAVVVMIFQETDYKKAFFLGVGLPSLLQSTISSGADVLRKAELLGSVHAQETQIDNQAATLMFSRGKVKR